MSKINALLATLLGTVLCAGAWAQKAPSMDLSAQAMVEVCSKTDDAAQNFCFGFGEGVYQGYLMSRDPKVAPTICFVPNKITREEVLADFLVWMKAHPQYNDNYAAETIVAYLADRYPCKK